MILHLKDWLNNTIETRRLRGDLLEVFKILNGNENIDRNTFAKKLCRLDIRKFKFSQKTVNEWNRVSADCVDANNVNMFKKKIELYLSVVCYN